MTDAADAPLLAATSLAVGYDRVPHLADVDLTLRAGELVALLGPNGAGKTTLVRALTGVRPPLEGRVELLDDDLTGLAPRDVARRLAVLPQHSAPLFPMTVLAAVLLGRAPWHAAWSFETAADVEIARESLSAVGALHLVDRDVTELSGGERQRVQLARALAQRGRVLICDEPTAGLDLKATGEVFEHLRRLARAGQGVLVVTHELELAAATCDRVLLLGHGRVIAEGEPAEVLTPEHLRSAFEIEVRVERDDRGRVRIVRRLEMEDELGAPGGAGEEA